MYKTKKFLRDVDDAKEQQYLFLREAIWKHMEAQRTYSMFVVTSILAYFTIIFTSNIEVPYVFLLPIIILFPFSNKILEHRISISYIAAYQIVCLENNHNVAKAFTWETDFFMFKNKKYDERINTWIDKLAGSESLLLGILSYGLYLIYFIDYFIEEPDKWDVQKTIGIICGIFFLFILWLIWKTTRGYHLYVNSIGSYIEKWLKFMLEEGRIDMDTYTRRAGELLKIIPK